MLCYIAVNEVQKGVVEIINVKAQAVFYLSILLGGLGECNLKDKKNLFLSKSDKAKN